MPCRPDDWYLQSGLSQGVIISSNIFFYQASKASLQAINTGNIYVIITLVSAKQVYNGKVKLFNEIEPFRSRFCSCF